MLFNSFSFLVFLPIVVIGFHLSMKGGRDAAKLYLIVASVVFYGWWEPVYVVLLASSVMANFMIGLAIHRTKMEKRPTGLLLALGVAFNLGLLGYFKYADFFLRTANDVFDTGFPALSIVLPLAISFFTFQQISFLADSTKDNVTSYRLLDYTLFVTFFPQLIAGPIVHHKQMIPQFLRVGKDSKHALNMAVGLTIFAIGLFKKTVLADNLAPLSDSLFEWAELGYEPSLIEAWLGTLAFTLEIYFDFSGYSDMALGLGRMFGIRLPLNFFSPYKATSIIDFWRRWHITLSTFFRDYLYIPLGGSRQGLSRRYISLVITMLLGGLWHGAAWTFVFWGGLHGFYLFVNHGWRTLAKRHGSISSFMATPLARVCSILLTFGCVVIAWVFFRATNFESAISVIRGMLGLNVLVFPEVFAQRIPGLSGVLASLGFVPGDFPVVDGTGPVVWLITGLFCVWALPNTVDFTARFRPALDPTGVISSPGRSFVPIPEWRITSFWAFTLAALAVLAVGSMNRIQAFIYFQF